MEVCNLDTVWYTASLEKKTAEVVIISDYLPYNIWIYIFMESHVYEFKHIIFQDNQSSIIMKKNGKK